VGAYAPTTSKRGFAPSSRKEKLAGCTVSDCKE
jgi:hypothetical protein